MSRGSQEQISKDRAGQKIKTPDGIGTIIAEYRVPTFSSTVPFVRTVRVELENGGRKEFTMKECRLIKIPGPNGGHGDTTNKAIKKNVGEDVAENTLRPTLIVRKIMQQAGNGRVFTNLYDNCRTVKCYADRGGDNKEMIKKIDDTLNNMGVEHSIKIRAPDAWAGEKIPSIIVRLPL